LFASDDRKIQTLDRMIESEIPRRVAALVHETDHAFELFDLEAVRHGWYGLRGLDGEFAEISALERSIPVQFDETLEDFVAAVVQAETGIVRTIDGQIRLPKAWAREITGAPGFDQVACVLRVTRDQYAYHDSAGNDVGFVGRTHPVLLHAIRHGIVLDGAVATARYSHIGIMFTFQIEVSVAGRADARHIAGIVARPGQSPVEVRNWLSYGDEEHSDAWDGIWDRHFAAWAGTARRESEELVNQIARERRDCVITQLERRAAARSERIRRWLETRANDLCGEFIPPIADLFGASEFGPKLRQETDAMARLTLLATHPETPSSKRREANDVVDLARTLERRDALDISVTSRLIGLLMLLPANVRRL
jgi:hypothetical protein